MSAQEEN